MKENLDNLEKMLDEAVRSLNKMSFSEKVENIDGLAKLIEANERMIQMRKIRLILFLRLVVLFIILIICLSHFVWR